MPAKRTDPAHDEVYDTMVLEILPEVVQRFLTKASDYGRTFEDLGVKGQYSDIHRKVRKLKKSMWDDEPLMGESASQILEDLIGNCLISLYLLGGPQEDG
jgi:hypothetical protein